LQLKPLGVLVRLFVQTPPWRQGDGTQKSVAFEHKLPEKPKAQVQFGVPVLLLLQVPPFKQTFVEQVLFCWQSNPEVPTGQTQLGVPVLLLQAPPFKQTFVKQAVQLQVAPVTLTLVAALKVTAPV
jgi:hypothetical protein